MICRATSCEAARGAASAPLPDRTDEELLLQYAANRDPLIFTELVVRHESDLFGYLHRFLGQVELARDVMQATFLQLHLKCETFQAGRRVRPWLYTIATNRAIDALRTHRRHWCASIDAAVSGPDGDHSPLCERLESPEGEPSANAELEERRRGVRQAVDQLPIHLRQLVRLIYFDGLKYREAAAALAIPVGTVKSRMHAAFSKLQGRVSHLAS